MRLFLECSSLPAFEQVDERFHSFEPGRVAVVTGASGRGKSTLLYLLGLLLMPVQVALILLLRRPPVVMALLPALRSTFGPADCVYIGWFGPIGIAAVYYAAFAVNHTGEEIIWIAASSVILASILAHSLTSAPFTKLYARRADRSPSQ